MLRRLLLLSAGRCAAQEGLFHRLLLARGARTRVPRAPLPAELDFAGLPLRQPAPAETFDYIVVGGGGAGCPLARTLADAGFRTLLIERGGLRSDHPLTWGLDGSGAALMDAAISQPVVTTEGYVSHVARVLGGGTSVNLGFYIEGHDDRFLSQFADQPTWQNATRWIRARIARPAPQKGSYADAIAQFTHELVNRTESFEPSYSPWAYGDSTQNWFLLNDMFTDAPVGTHTGFYSPRYIRGSAWYGMSIFESKQVRLAADTLLGPVDEFPKRNLVVALNTTVSKVTFVRNVASRRLSAKCVEIHDSTATGPILSKAEAAVNVLQSEENLRGWFEWYPNIVRFIGSIFRGKPAPPKRLVCLNDNPDSEVILSAGAIFTPQLLFQSGVGPVEETRKLGLTNILPLQHLGKFLGDRIFLPVAFFFNQLASLAPHIVQSIALWDDKPVILPDGKLDSRPARPEQSLQVALEEVQGWPRHADEEPRCPTKMSSIDALLNIDESKHTEDQDYNSLQGADIDPLAMSEEDLERELPMERHPELSTARLFGDNDRVFPISGSPQLVGLEEISGGMMTAGCGVATRYFLPPKLRTSVAVDVAVDALFGCALHSGSGGLFNFCPIVDPIMNCFKQSAALVYLLPQPYSKGSVTVGGPNGKSLVVEGGYFNDPRDLEAAVVGMGAILRQLNQTGAFDYHYQFTNSTSAVCPAIIRDKLSSLFYKMTRLLSPYIGMPEAEEAADALENAADLGGMVTSEALFARHQKFASFPPILPDADDPDQLASFIQRHSTSMWHWHGSAGVGKVVDHDFRVAGTTNLAIVDASVLNQLPNMNPQVAIMTLGRYAGLLRTQRRQVLAS